MTLKIIVTKLDKNIIMGLICNFCNRQLYKTMANQKNKCPHCGSTSTLPIAYGYMADEVHKKNHVKNLLLKFKSFIGLSSAKHK